PLMVLAQGIGILQAREAMPALLADSVAFQWATYLGYTGGMVAIALALGRRFGLSAGRLGVLLAGLLAIEAVLAMQDADRYWYPAADESDRPRLSLSQESFERQQALWDESVHALAPQRPGVRDVYGVVFAPYANEDVFLRESTMVAEVLEDRFDAQGRVLQLVNHPTTSDRLPWATPLNLKRAIEAIARRMDRERDLLVVYLTSHGGSNFKLAAAHWPLQVDTVSPGELRSMLDQAGVRHRVIAISACYSGGWVGPLASDTSLVMTAADADHTSYGCGRRSELTFFGRALFDEQLRSTWSFEQAFAAAVPVIRQREVEARKPDGFSNPQISVGEKIRPVLQDIARRLERTPGP
ncbi:MAG TPA: C13 family peptidase, partial [Ramlibacter sp.]